MTSFRPLSLPPLLWAPLLMLSWTTALAADDDHLVVGTGERVEANDRVIDTTGAGIDAVLVQAGGQLHTHNLSLSTWGAQARGIRLQHPGSTLVASGRLEITTWYDAGHGVWASESAQARIEQAAIQTHGDQAHGVYLRTAEATLGGGSIHTRGAQSHGFYARDQSQLSASNLQIVTEGERAHGVVIKDSRAALEQTHVHAQGQEASAVSMDGASLDVQGGSLQSQSGPAVRIAGVGNQLSIGGAYVASAQGAVFRLENGTRATVQVNDSTLSAAGGTGEILDLGENVQLDLVIDRSVVHGNLTVEQGSEVNVSLRNGTRLEGQLSGVGELEVEAGGYWQVAGNSQIDRLLMSGGQISFGDVGAYQRLALGELNGEGLFNLRLDANQRLTDLLDVSGRAEGRYQVRLQASGAEPEAGFEPLEVIRTGGGDAEFSLVNGRVDLGAFSYGLDRQGDSWYVSAERGGVSPSTRTVQALFNTAPSIWYGELSTLRSRMGEVRGSGQGGAWMRSYGNQYNVDTGGGLGYRQRQMGLSLGVDTVARSADSQWLVGVLGGYSHSDLSLSRGSSGQVDSYYLGAYGTWLADSGWYADALVKANQFQNQADVRMSDGARARGDYVSHGLGASLELGRHIKLGEELFVEPFTQWSGLLVGGRQFELDNGLRAQNASTGSLLGKAGATLGRTHQLAQGGIVQPYLKAALAHEFARGNGVKVNGHRFKNDLAGSRGELGAGVAVAMSSNLQLHGHVDYMGGEQIEQPWGVNVGMRYAFD
ncbi:autotransporter outer membrane beta-barrel domain-containing protein [Pseudomonas sp. HR96]|uniref:autotransporter outer membrane beta-barrel domain-containing protein n=1 Tax=Pseudomonas sp. HR96 TaxID=1027966 RepID=UPI002A748EC3|nr:autotransporter outer membrane beta-barrel domain-containing protein [Pseudomonas sp. HR96]WPP01439.1 autotransporter outer membrane beta-barrel domain-containing protein [Pseudomonas sp. HR96]